MCRIILIIIIYPISCFIDFQIFANMSNSIGEHGRCYKQSKSCLYIRQLYNKLLFFLYFIFVLRTSIMGNMNCLQRMYGQNQLSSIINVSSSFQNLLFKYFLVFGFCIWYAKNLVSILTYLTHVLQMRMCIKFFYTLSLLLLITGAIVGGSVGAVIVLLIVVCVIVCKIR